ncbi:MAG: Trm112 family protein [Chloroflexota bacterium]|nr:MAG: Trm112 family protein [Chloroflexota bacterium]
MVSAEMIAVLVCPTCLGELSYDESAERLDCRPCALGYPVVNGVPVMLVDKAERLPRLKE